MNKWFTLIFSCVLVTLFAANYPYSNIADSEKSSSTPDAELSKKINEKLAPGVFSKGWKGVKATVSQGIVTLQGSVMTWNDKDTLEKEIRDINGVRGVKSDLKVQEPKSKEKQSKKFNQDTYSNQADEQLNNKIRDSISSGIIWDSYNNISLNTINGNVVLEGSIKNDKDQQTLMNKIQKIEGVKSVKSNLRIEENE